MSHLSTLSLQADWSSFLRRPTWSTVSSFELATVLGVHLQTINNWKIRGYLPPQVIHPKLKGNKNYYRISSIRSLLENRPEEEIHWEWAKLTLSEFMPIPTLGQVEFVVNGAYKFLNVEKPTVPGNFCV